MLTDIIGHIIGLGAATASCTSTEGRIIDATTLLSQEGGIAGIGIPVGFTCTGIRTIAATVSGRAVMRLTAIVNR